MKHSEILNLIALAKGIIPKQKELAEVVDKPIGTINSRASRDLNYPENELKKIEKFYNISLANQPFIDDMKDINDNICLDYYPDIFGSCGTGTFVLSETKCKIEVPKRIILNYFPFNEYSVINAYGDSMMPYICDKDILIIEHCNCKQIKDNKVYVFRFKDNIFVKRLVNNVNQVIIKSDNPEYETIKIQGEELNDLQVIGQVVGLMRGM